MCTYLYIEIHVGMYIYICGCVGVEWNLFLVRLEGRSKFKSPALQLVSVQGEHRSIMLIGPEEM